MTRVNVVTVTKSLLQRLTATQVISSKNVAFLTATAALEVQMFVCLYICMSHLLQLYYSCTTAD